MKKELLLFDLDGTLIDSSADLAESINFMLKKLQKDTYSKAEIDTWVGNGAQTLVKRALSGSKDIDTSIFTQEFFQKALLIFLDHYKENVCVHTSLYPQVYETLKKLYELNYMLVIITNKPYEFVAPILEKLNIFNFFRMYLGGDSLEFKKPHPQPLLHVCEKFHMVLDNVVMIGDSKNDILAAKSAGIQSVAVSYGYNYGEDISKYNPDYIIENFGEIISILEP